MMIIYRMMDVQGVDGFEWDENNSEKIWIKHHVYGDECEELFFNLPLIIARDRKHSQAEKRFYALGQTNGGRLLFVVFTIRNNKIRIISARDMNLKEAKAYAKANT
jgi:uncharacterized DUF497 family protein